MPEGLSKIQVSPTIQIKIRGSALHISCSIHIKSLWRHTYSLLSAFSAIYQRLGKVRYDISSGHNYYVNVINHKKGKWFAVCILKMWTALKCHSQVIPRVISLLIFRVEKYLWNCRLKWPILVILLVYLDVQINIYLWHCLKFIVRSMTSAVVTTGSREQETIGILIQLSVFSRNEQMP